MVNKYEELAGEIIDSVCEVVEQQHPELKLKTKYAKESDVLDNPAVIVGVDYYNLENDIAIKIKKIMKKWSKK